MMQGTQGVQVKGNASATQIVVVGGGFAGLWATIAASRKLAGHDSKGASVTLVSRDPYLTIRPRLYEASPRGLRVPLASVLKPINAHFREATVVALDPYRRRVELTDGAASLVEIPYERLILATGSELRPLPIPGLAEHSFNIDTFAAAIALDNHLVDIGRAASAWPGRDTIVIVGAGFTGIELATAMRSRLATQWSQPRAAAARVILVQRSGAVAPDLGANVRPYIEEALREQRIELRVHAQLAEVGARTIRFASGEQIEASTTIFTTGLQASPLAKAVPGAVVDELGRLQVDDTLRVRGVEDIYAAGDVARAYVDDDHLALMSCQHAILMGEVAGHNAARDLLGLAPLPYRQPDYVTCLDLGPTSALFTEGWERLVRHTGSEGRKLKRQINTEWIYPPKGDRTAIYEAIRIDLQRSKIDD